MCIAHKISRVLPAALLAGLALLSTPSVGSAERGGLFDWFGSSWFGPPTRPPPPPAPPPARPPRDFATPGPLTATGPIVNDTARYLAGLQPPAGSPIAALTREDGWAGHARFFDRAFGELDRTQLAKIRAWSAASLQPRRPTMFYMFSGPDFLYADAFFPSASTYVQAGLANLHAPLRIDLLDANWDAACPFDRLVAIVAINVVHISPWRVSENLFAGAARRLGPDGRLFVYGPFKVDGAHTAPSNEAFDATLRAQNAEWGVRDMRDLAALAAAHGLRITETVPMPANNFTLVISSDRES